MIPLTARKIAEIIGGELLCGDAGTLIDQVQYDSRSVVKGSLFVPIKGERVDAHKFIEQCLVPGAATLTEYDAPDGAVLPYIKTDSTLSAMQKLAAWYRRQFPKLHLVGVTGSVGKTSTKEMIAAALTGGFCVMKTQGNKNSQIGMPSTMFDISPEHEAAVIEMGISEFGEMDRLCDISRPEYAVMTNIGVAHLENLKTQENIMSEKLKITKHFGSDGVLFLNGDDRLLKTLYGDQPFRTVSFGISTENDYYAEGIVTKGFGTEFVCCHNGVKTEYKIPALGEHSVRNALAAIAVSEQLGMSSEQIQTGLMSYKNAPMRQQIIEADGFTIIDDSYNASPDAVRVSLNVLSDIAKGRTIAVLADMLELGENENREHYDIGKYLAEKGIDTLIAIGRISQNTAQGARESGCENVYSFGNNEEAYECLSKLTEPGCTILVKGSRGMHTDEIVKKLIKK